MAVLEGGDGGGVVGGGGNGAGLADDGAAVSQGVDSVHSGGRHPTVNLTKLVILNV